MSNNGASGVNQWVGYIIAVLLAGVAMWTIWLGMNLATPGPNGAMEAMDATTTQRELARRMVDLGLPIDVTDENLEEIYKAVLKSAEKGDANAALVIMEIARLQREPETALPAVPADPDADFEN